VLEGCAPTRRNSWESKTMAVWAFAFTLGLGGAAGMNIVNRQSGKCLDLHAPCKDGRVDPNCDRMAFEDLKAGTNLQLFRCNGHSNQEFEFLANGRIRNPLSDLCIDIAAPCKDHYREPCERVPVTELKGSANIQLFICHEDSGILSNSYGNQKWNFNVSQLQNKESNLCLGPMAAPTLPRLPDMSNIEAETCEGKPHQLFDFMESPKQQALTKFQVGHTMETFQKLSDNEFRQRGLRGLPQVGQPLAAAAVVCGFVVAALTIARARRPSGGDSPPE